MTSERQRYPDVAIIDRSREFTYYMQTDGFMVLVIFIVEDHIATVKCRTVKRGLFLCLICV